MSVPRVVLAGLGHAHLFVLEALARDQLPRCDVHLVCPAEYDYSGMISGTVAGCYRAQTPRFQPESLAYAAGARWTWGRVRRIDAAGRRVMLEDGAEVPYDLLSVDVGSRPAGDRLPGVGRHAIPVKPVRHALRFRSASARASADASPGWPARLVIVGAGAAGVEISLCLDAALRAHFGAGRHRLTLLHAGERIVPEYPERFRKRVEQLLQRRGIGLRAGARGCAVEDGQVLVEQGEPEPFDALLWATGPRAPQLFRRSGLPTDEDGYLQVEETLRCAEHPEIFGAGDCITIRGYPWVPKAGVYAVREGPVLATNLARTLRREPLKAYRPQRHWLSLMNTGDGRALLHWRGVVAHNRAAWWLKDRIDRRFVKRFQRLDQR